MVQEGIVLGHKISEHGTEVDKAKVEVIKNFPPPTSIKGVRSFLGYSGFYRRFIKDFSKISKPLSSLLMKDVSFDFNSNCLRAYEDLKERLVTAPVLVAPDWNIPFEVMCDASDTAVGAVLGQRQNKIKDKKGVENVVVDHLSRLELMSNDCVDHAINDWFPDEQLFEVKHCPWCVAEEEFGQILDHFHDREGIDFMGPFPSSFTKKYILVTVDYVSKWVETEAYATNDSHVVLKFLKKNIFNRFGTPRAIISDGGTHFCNKLFEKILSKYGVTHKISTPYHPQMSGQVEVSNREIKRILEKVVGVKLEHRAYWATKALNFNYTDACEQRLLQLDQLKEFRNLAYDLALSYKEKKKRAHDRQIIEREFKEGENVLLYNSRLLLFSGKLKSRWSGLFVISKVYPSGAVELQDGKDGKFTVNAQRLKHYMGGTIEPQLGITQFQDNPN
ncbi:uncharacterized protein [Primulina huaijiensis]|uniref:uncharacterized protein n=1 Tax=Primulina huaijiensis TaxID=1492673 RepID=UPI003CC74014